MTPFLALAVLAAPTIEPSLQLRPRVEKTFVDDHIAGKDAAPGYRVTQRSRVGVKAKDGGVSAKLSVQDVRMWAAEANTLGDFSAEGVDFHDAWLAWGKDAWTLRVGRQEVALDGQRLIGSVNWTQQGRAFDGLRFLWDTDTFDFTFFAARVPDGDTHDLFVAHGKIAVGSVKLSFPVILQMNNLVAKSERTAEDDTNRVTAGLRAASAEGKFKWRAEAYGQSGTDHFAYMAGVRAGYVASPSLSPTLWVDYLSGDGDHTDEETGTFDTLFATNHKFYGFQDRFLNLPVHTAGGGLIDLALKNNTKIGEGKLHVAVHEFMLAQDNAADLSGAIGLEVDIIFTYPIAKALKLQIGESVFMAQGDFKDVYAEEISDWTYVQLDANF